MLGVVSVKLGNRFAQCLHACNAVCYTCPHLHASKWISADRCDITIADVFLHAGQTETRHSP